jgi:hypothetical protein
MQDRPTYDELLSAIERFLDEEIVPNVPGSRGFHARVAANAVRAVRRELEAEEEQLAAEWAGLDHLLGPTERPEGRSALREAIAARNAELSERIRRGDADSGAFGVSAREHVRRTVRGKLSVSNPRWTGHDSPGASEQG